MITTPDHTPSPMTQHTEKVNASGALIWGAKRSLQRYIASLPDGVCEVSSEVGLPGSGRFAFPLTAVDVPRAQLRFSGMVTFRGHQDLLSIPIADPWLTWVRDTWELSCCSTSTLQGRLVLATAGPAQRVDSDVMCLHPTLAQDGAIHFGGNYAPDEPLDDMFVQLAPTDCLSVGGWDPQAEGSSHDVF